MTDTKRVLIVDDRKLGRDTVRGSLRRLGCDCMEAATGATALTLIAEHFFDVIFLDIGLPDIPGLDIVRQARSQDWPFGKIIVYTGLPDPESKAEAESLGVFRYLIKQSAGLGDIRRAFVEALPDLSKPPMAPADDQTKHEPDERPRILVLDDDRDFLETLERDIGSDYAITSTSDPDEATRQALQGQFSLVVLDQRLSYDAAGNSVLGRMRKAVATLKAIIITADPHHSSAEEESIQLGAAYWVPKEPLGELKSKIKTILETKLRVFLAYASEDYNKVLRLYKKLKKNGFEPWMDKKQLVAGLTWRTEIGVAINHSNYFIYCLSRYSREKSPHIPRELDHAMSWQESFPPREIFFITCRLENIDVPQRFKHLHHVDLFKPNGFLQLLEALSSRKSIKKGVQDYIDKNNPNLQQQVPDRIEKALSDDPRRERIRALMAGGEKGGVEFKASARWDMHLNGVNKELAKVVAKTVAAFLNSEAGGVLLIGVDDDGKAIGLARDYRTLKKQDRDGFHLFLMNLFADTYGKDVSSLLIRIEFYDIDGCDVCCVVANPAPMPVYARDSAGGENLYIRQGNSSVFPSMREAAEYIKLRWK